MKNCRRCSVARNRFMILRLATLLLLVSLFGCASPDGKSAMHVAIHWNTNRTQNDFSVNSFCAGVGYLMARAVYVQDHKAEYSGEIGVVKAHFSEEVSARTKAATIYDELGRNGHIHYFDDLLKVKKAGYMKEYVWVYLRQPTWTPDEEPKNLSAFSSWAQKNIPDHQIETGGSISIEN